MARGCKEKTPGAGGMRIASQSWGFVQEHMPRQRITRSMLGMNQSYVKIHSKQIFNYNHEALEGHEEE